MSNDATKILNKHLKEAEHQGLVVRKLPSGHISVTNPDTGQRINVPCTPALGRNTLNAIARMRRIGYVKPNQFTKGKKS
jgi:hypothetical protein